MPEVRLIPLGVGEAFSARRYTTCMALGCGDDWLLLDCPHPVRKMLREATDAAGIPLDLEDIRAVALSHLHADHCSGLEDYAYYSYFALGRRATVAAHPRVSTRLWPNVLAAGMDRAVIRANVPPEPMTRDDYFDVLDLDDDAPVSLGPFSIECRPTAHSIPTTAFRISCGGRLLGFSADTPHDPALVDWLSPCDLILHEATSFPESPVHTPLRHLAALPEPLRRKIRIFHYADDLDPSTSPVEALHQGRCYPV